MKVITITEGNIKDVYGRVRKFFYNKNKTGFEEWHNFDCGFKKHINRYILLEGDKKKVRTCNMYPSPDEIELVKRNNTCYIVVRLMTGYGFSLKPGDKIAFLGNRIVYRTDFFLGHKYLYTTMQATKMTQYKQKKMRDWAEEEHRQFEEDYYKELEES